MKHTYRTVLVAVSASLLLLVPAASVGAAQSAFSTTLQLPGSFGFGEPSITIGSGRIVVTAPNGDRPWLAYSRTDQSLYVVYDGFDAVHVARASLAAGPQGGIAFVQDVPAVPECLIGDQYLVHNNKPQLKLANPCYAGTPVTI